MAEQEDLELTFHHKPIKTTDTYRATLAENNLQTRTVAVIQKKSHKGLHRIWQEGRRNDLDMTYAPSR